MKFFKNNWIITLILLTAFILRWLGTFYGFPLNLATDEAPTLLSSLKMIGTGSLKVNATNFYYLPVLSYIYLPFLIIFLLVGKLSGFFINNDHIKEVVFLNFGTLIPLVRFISVILGTATVYLVYKIGNKLINNETGIISALLLATSFFHSGVSHFANTWTAQTFFILLVLLWSINLYQKEKENTKDYLLGGLLISLAFGINFIGIISYFWLILAHFLRNKKKSFSQIFIKDKNFWLANLVIILMIVLFYFLNPFGLNNYFNRITDTTTPAVVGGEAVYKIFHLSTLQTLWFYLKNSFILEPFIFLLTIICGFILWKKQRIAFSFLIPWIIIYYLLLSPLTGSINRYALPVIPIMVIVVAYLLEKIIRYKKIGYLLLIFIVVYSLLFSVLFDLRLLKKDTRQLARNWIISNILSGSLIKNNNLNESLGLIESPENINFINEVFPEMMSTKRNYLLNLPEENYPQPNYFLIIYDYDKRVELNLEPDYILQSHFDKNKLESQVKDIPNNYQIVATFFPKDYGLDELSSRNVLDAPFSERGYNPWYLLKSYDYYGPYIEIYKLKGNAEN